MGSAKGSERSRASSIIEDVDIVSSSIAGVLGIVHTNVIENGRDGIRFASTSIARRVGFFKGLECTVRGLSNYIKSELSLL